MEREAETLIQSNPFEWRSRLPIKQREINDLSDFFQHLHSVAKQFAEMQPMLKPADSQLTELNINYEFAVRQLNADLSLQTERLEAKCNSELSNVKQSHARESEQKTNQLSGWNTVYEERNNKVDEVENLLLSKELEFGDSQSEVKRLHATNSEQNTWAQHAQFTINSNSLEIGTLTSTLRSINLELESLKSSVASQVHHGPLPRHDNAYVEGLQNQVTMLRNKRKHLMAACEDFIG